MRCSECRANHTCKPDPGPWVLQELPGARGEHRRVTNTPRIVAGCQLCGVVTPGVNGCRAQSQAPTAGRGPLSRLADVALCPWLPPCASSSSLTMRRVTCPLRPWVDLGRRLRPVRGRRPKLTGWPPPLPDACLPTCWSQPFLQKPRPDSPLGPSGRMLVFASVPT